MVSRPVGGLSNHRMVSRDVVGLPLMAPEINRRNSRAEAQSGKSRPGNDFRGRCHEAQTLRTVSPSPCISTAGNRRSGEEGTAGASVFPPSTAKGSGDWRQPQGLACELLRA